MEGGTLSDICHLSPLQKQNLYNLEQTPELPSSLRLLDSHGSNQLLQSSKVIILLCQLHCSS